MSAYRHLAGSFLVVTGLTAGAALLGRWLRRR